MLDVPASSLASQLLQGNELLTQSVGTIKG